MFLGSGSFISTTKAPSKEVAKPAVTAKRLMFLDSSITDSSVEVLQLPSPASLRKCALYAVFDGKVYWLRGIKPNINPVSLFVGNSIVNEDHFLATFKFDVIFIFTSLLFLKHDKFISVPQRIYELYRSGVVDSEECSVLESGMLALWNHNVDKVQDRLEYLCQKIKSDGSKDPLLKPNIDSFRAMLEHKVQSLEKAVQKSNLMMGSYCRASETSCHNHVRKNYIDFREGKLRLFCWSVISQMLNPEARSHLVPAKCDFNDISSHLQSTSSTAPLITSGNKGAKQRKITVAKGTPSILGFFKRT
ncbi:uncharacterized protein BXIN_0373 [Babesia sp. Xinjiang]|uniref:uncharacterized protein n=1 Tax=Babesia sp. Xinjiang TaxID=462227 RepID=UPI000A22C42D|nr:uncharacterized protein BXIN_0373 [Babesia sp. Xinjiang]ORM41177.1 hypothetical protein BXIN_0373 [Babesia sp. Xinjiang]